MRRVRLLEQSFPGQGCFDTAVSRALLEGVAAGREPESLRLYVPDDVLAFSAADRARPGFREAVVLSRSHGFEPVLRLAGGSAAVFHTGTLAFAWSRPTDHYRSGIRERFEELSSILAAGLRRLGVDARVGEVAGEYCPGAHSVNARGKVKLVGVGQRVVPGAAHVGGVIVASGAERVRDVLLPTYAALGLEFDPATVGSALDESAIATPSALREALLEEFGRHHELQPERFPQHVLEAATREEARHRIDPTYSSSATTESIGPKIVGEPPTPARRS